ncbi:hypothetical protein RYH73_14845 [Olivibacter sp. CPCC 100613]|uniref:hypothetical protein n=1 Tax=Olivibacter sp. CPCC 100613 TaxID=3079931 RepID=UPI002FF712E5
MKTEVKKKESSRLSLDDFKAKKMDSQNDIDSFLGGIKMYQANCHSVTVEGLDWVINKAEFD